MADFYERGDCIECKCDDFPVTDPLASPKETCKALNDLNKHKVKETALVLKYGQGCDLPQQTSKGFYALWCVNKHLIKILCKIIDKLASISNYDDSGLKERLSALEGRQGYDDSGLKARVTALENKPEKTVDLSGYVPKAEHDKTLQALNRIIANLEASGAWQGGLNGNFVQGRNIASGNINIFGGSVDGNSFIRTNRGQTENDLAGGL